MKNKFISNLLISGSASYFSKGLLFMSSIITARLLTPKDFGIVGLVTVFTGFLGVFADSGISIAVIRSNYGSLYFRGLSTMLILVGFLLMLVTLLLTYPIVYFYSQNELILIAPFIGLMFLINSLSGVSFALLNKRKEFKKLGLFEIVSTIFSILLTILFAWLDFRYWALILPQFLVSVLKIFVCNYLASFNIKLLGWKYVIASFKKTRHLISHISGFNLVNYWSRNFDNLLIGKNYGAESLGIYSKAYGMLVLPLSVVNGAINKVAFPTMVEMKGRGEDINQFYIKIMNNILFISVLIGIPLILFPKQIVYMLWGEKWLRVADILPYFGVLIFTQLIISFSGNIILLKEKDKQYMYFGWVTGFFLIIGIYIGYLISFEAIPLVYAVAFLIGPLFYNAFYIHVKHLGFSLKQMLNLWLPIIIMSYLLILTIYFEYDFIIKFIISMVLLAHTSYKNKYTIVYVFRSFITK